MDLALGVALNLILFFLIGLGPSLLLRSGKERMLLGLGIAGPAGFVLVTLAGTYLTIFDIPVSRWLVPTIIIAILCSVLAGWMAMRSTFGSRHLVERKAIKFGIAGLALTFVLREATGLGLSGAELLARAETNPKLIEISDGVEDISVSPTRGINTVTLQVRDAPTVSLKTDPSPLLLRVEDLRVVRTEHDGSAL